MSMEVIATLSAHSDRAWQAVWSPDGTTLASCSGDKTVKLWRATDAALTRFRCVATLEGVHSRTVRSIAFSPDGQFIAASSFDGLVSIWYGPPAASRGDDSEWECIAQLEGHENEVKRVAWSHNGEFLASCSRDKTVWVWATPQSMHSTSDGDAKRAFLLDDVSSDFECVSVCSGHSQDVKSVVFHPTSNLLLSCSYDNSMKLWREEADDWFCASTLTGHTSTVWEALWCRHSGDAQEIVSVSDDKTIRVWRKANNVITDTTVVNSDSDRYAEVQVLAGYHKRTIFSVSENNPNSESKVSLIATGAADDSIAVFARTDDTSAPLRHCFTQLAAHSGDVNSVAFHPKHPNVLVSAGDDGLVKVWRVHVSDPATQ